MNTFIDDISITRRGELAYEEHGRIQNALKLREEVLGKEHPETLTLMNDLAVSCSKLGREQEALKLNEEAVEICRRTLSMEHPNTLVSINVRRILGLRFGI